MKNFLYYNSRVQNFNRENDEVRGQTKTKAATLKSQHNPNPSESKHY